MANYLPKDPSHMRRIASLGGKARTRSLDRVERKIAAIHAACARYGREPIMLTERERAIYRRGWKDGAQAAVGFGFARRLRRV